MRLTTIFTISFFLVALVVSLILGISSNYSLNKVLTKHIYDHLEGVAQSRIKHIQTLLESKKARAIDFSSDAFIKDSLIRLNQGDNPSQITQDLINYLMVNKLPLDEDFYEIYVLDDKAGIVAETEHEKLEDYEELDFTEDPLFLEGRKAPYLKEVFYDVEFRVKGIAVSAPILSEEKLLGVVIIKMYLDSLANITTDATGLGERGEVYIVNKDSLLITPSRFLKGETKGVLTQVVDTENSRNCFSMTVMDKHGGHDPTIPFLNYRGGETIGTHRHILEPGWCLLVEVDEEEALTTPRRKAIKENILVSTFVVIIFTLTGLFIGRFLDKKIYIKEGDEIK